MGKAKITQLHTRGPQSPAGHEGKEREPRRACVLCQPCHRAGTALLLLCHTSVTFPVPAGPPHAAGLANAVGSLMKLSVLRPVPGCIPTLLVIFCPKRAI